MPPAEDEVFGLVIGEALIELVANGFEEADDFAIHSFWR
jgi:hypothetical protein